MKLASCLARPPAALALLLAAGCNVNQPAAGAGYTTPLIQHASAGIVDAPCSQCHAKEAPLPLESLAHGGGAECNVCHAPKDDSAAGAAGWLPRLDFNHVPRPPSCLACHVQERPTATDAAHPKTGDCAGCHDYPVFKAR